MDKLTEEHEISGRLRQLGRVAASQCRARQADEFHHLADSVDVLVVQIEERDRKIAELESANHPLTREYKRYETIEAGDIITFKDSIHPFDTYIISNITLDEDSNRIATIARAYMVCNAVGVAFVTISETTVPCKMLREKFVVYTTGKSGTKDNRMGL